MRLYLVTQVGTFGPGKPIRAHGPLHAAAEAAGCTWRNVPLPEWRALGDYPRWMPVRHWVACYMPLDNTGRQWLVSGANGEPIAC